MRKALLLLIPLGLAPLAGLALPAVAESGTGACSSTAASAGPIDLNAIPAKTVSGHLAIAGGGDDECGGDDGIRSVSARGVGGGDDGGPGGHEGSEIE